MTVCCSRVCLWSYFSLQFVTDVQISESLHFILADVWLSLLLLNLLFVVTVADDIEWKLVKRVGCIGCDCRMEEGTKEGGKQIFIGVRIL